MRKTIVVGLALAALMAPPVVAAELPVKAPPPPPAPVYPWTGCYVGVNVGFVGVRTRTSWDGVGDGGLSTNDVAAGGQIGCDYQLSSNWVIGIQGLIDGTNIRAQHTPVSFPDLTFDANVNWFATITARIGYAIAPSVLLYGKFGWAEYQNHFDVFTNCTSIFALNNIPGCSSINPTPPPVVLAAGPVGFANVNRNQGGFDVGIGAEFLLTGQGIFSSGSLFAPIFSGWSLWVEYDHIFSRDTTLFFANPFNPASTPDRVAETAATIRRDFNKVLFGLNWRFKSGGGGNGGATTEP